MMANRPRAEKFECCRQMLIQIIDRRSGVAYEPAFREFLLAPRGTSSEEWVRLMYCPWCGAKLPDSVRGLWAERVKQMGFSTSPSALRLYPAPGMPREYLTDEWWRLGEVLP